MTWVPKHGHVSQLQVDPASGALTGRNDCWEASLTRYLFEAGKVQANAKDALVINAVSLAARGTPDSPGNFDTNLPQASASLAHWNLPENWTNDYQAALNSPWAILLVDGTVLEAAQYPFSWFPGSGQGNHFILWLPKWQGAVNFFNDPLAFNNGQKDCQYDLSSVARAFYGAYLLPSTGNGETAPQTWVNTRGAPFGLLAQPRHGSTALAIVPAGGSGLVEPGYMNDGAGTNWRAGQWRDKHGWFPNQYVTLTP